MPKQDNPDNPNQAYKAYGRILAAVIKMGVTIFVFVWLGRYIDSYFQAETPWSTIVFSLLGVSVSLYVGLKDFLTNDD